MSRGRKVKKLWKMLNPDGVFSLKAWARAYRGPGQDAVAVWLEGKK